MAMTFDAGHYLGTAQMLVAWLYRTLQLAPNGQPAFSNVNITELPRYLLLDGPLIPFAGALPFAILGRIPGGGDWQIFIAIETVFHAAASVLVAAITSRIADGLEVSSARPAGLAAGLCWALYPAAVIGSGCYLTEVPIVACLLLFVLALSNAVGGRLFWSIVAGLCAALVFTTKPGLVFGLFAAVVLFSWACASSNAWKKLAALLAGGGLVIMPWLIFTHATTGHWYACAHRLPTFNAAKGGDISDDGWQTEPSTPMSARFTEEDGPLKAILTPWREDAAASFNLLCRKAERMWSFPWNDFRSRFLGMPTLLQVWWHRLLILIAMIGIVGWANRTRRIQNRAAALAASACTALICGHFAYLLFETLPRYGFTAMPFFVILGVAAISMGSPWKRNHLPVVIVAGMLAMLALSFDLLPILLCFSPTIQIAYVLEFLLRAAAAVAATTAAYCSIAKEHRTMFGAITCATMCGVIITSVAAHLFADREQREWRAVLKPGCIAERCANLSTAKITAAPDWALVLLDTDNNVNDATIRVNGRQLPDKPVSLLAIDGTADYRLTYLQALANVQRKDTTAFRQWRAVRVPLQWVNLSGKNNIAVECPANRKLTIYGAFRQFTSQSQPFLSPIFVSPDRMMATTNNLETRVVTPGLRVPIGPCRYIRAGHAQSRDLSPEAGRQTGDYHIYLALGKPSAGKAATRQVLPSFVFNKVDIF